MKNTLYIVISVILIALTLSACGTGTPPDTTVSTATATDTTASATDETTVTPSATTAATAVTTTTTATATTTTEPRVTFTAASPVAVFSADDIALLDIAGLSEDPEEIAEAIRTWQEDTWTYAANPADHPDVSDPIRWNYFLPGIYDSRAIILDRLQQGSLYGICFDYAVVYCSVARYYGLEARVVNSLSKPGDTNPDTGPTTGLSPQEYERLNVKLNNLGLSYDYEAVRLVAEETPGHYWAEVKLNGEWVVQDATQKAVGFYTTADYYVNNDYTVTDWLSRDRSAELDEYQRMIENGERLPEPQDDGDSAPDRPADYTGMTDDLGQPGRAANIDDLLKGWALAPYFSDAADAYDFIQANVPQDIIDEDQWVQDEYEERTGQPFYLVAVLACDSESGSALAAAYLEYTGEELDITVFMELFGD